MIPALYFINFALFFSDCEFKIVDMMFKDKFSKKFVDREVLMSSLRI